MYVQTMPFRVGSAVEVRHISVSLRSNRLAQCGSCWEMLERTHHSKSTMLSVFDQSQGIEVGGVVPVKLSS